MKNYKYKKNLYLQLQKKKNVQYCNISEIFIDQNFNTSTPIKAF